MNAMTEITLYNGVDLDRAQAETAGLGIRNTFWGYYVPSTATSNSPVVRGVVGAISVALATIGLLIWSGSNLEVEAGLLAMKVIVSGFFIICGIMTGQYAQSTDRPEIQVDTARGELRYAVRNNRDRVKVFARSAFLNVCDVVLIDEGDAKSLQIEFVDGREVWEIARGEDEELRPLMYRLNRDFARGGLDSLVSRPDPKAL